MEPVVVYSRLTALPASIDMLEAESEADGFRMIARLRTEWNEGTNRFDREGEVLFGAHLDGRLIGVGGLNRDPYRPDPKIGRVRHLYVLQDHRRLGVGRALVEMVVDHARARFSALRLWTDRAGSFYERIGFRPVSEDRATHRLDMVAAQGKKTR